MVNFRRPVGLPPVRETPETPTKVPDTAASWLTKHVLRPVWLWRREVAIGVVPIVAGVAWAWAPLDQGVLISGWGLLYGTVLALACVPGVRAWVGRWVRLGRLKRQWDMACRFSGVETVSVRIPRIGRAEFYPAGQRVQVRIPRGKSVEDLEEATGRLAVALDAQEVRVTRNTTRAAYPWVDVQRRNPFRDGRGVVLRPRSPLLDAREWSLWDGVPAGLDAIGSAVSLHLPGRNILVGGEPESGKSSVMSQILGAATLDPSCHMYGIDGKRVELALWSSVMETLAYTMDDAQVLLREVVVEMDQRYANLEARRARSVTRSMGWPLILVVIDELRFFTDHSDRKSKQQFESLLIDLLARGRACGVIVAAATQKPSSDVVNTSIRDLFAFRWALRCTTREASDTVLGAGWASQGYDTSGIDTMDRGLGMLRAEGALPASVKSCYLTDDDIDQLIARGSELRTPAV